MKTLYWMPLHNVLFGQYVYLATEQAETYLKICVLVYHLTYICPSLFDCKVNTFFFIFVYSPVVDMGLFRIQGYRTLQTAHCALVEIEFLFNSCDLVDFESLSYKDNVNTNHHFRFIIQTLHQCKFNYIVLKDTISVAPPK